MYSFIHIQYTKKQRGCWSQTKVHVSFSTYPKCVDISSSVALLLSLYSRKPSQIPIGLSLKPEFNPGYDLTASRDSVTPRGGQGLHPACLWPALFSRLLHPGCHPKHIRLRLPSTGKWHEGLLASEEPPMVLHLEIMPEMMKVKPQVWRWLATDCSQMNTHLTYTHTLSDAPLRKASILGA